MNICIKNSSGDFIAILNSDDIYQSESIIEEVVNIIKKNKNINIFLGNLIYFKDNNYYKIVRFYSAKKFKPWMFRYGLMPPHPSSFIRRSLYKKYGLYEERFKIASDFDLFLRLIFIKRIAYKTINKIIVRMRTGGVSGKNINSYITINNEINQSFKKNNINVKIFQFLLRGLSKLGQFIILNQDIHNKNFKLSGLKFDKDELFKNNFNFITNINKIPFNKNFILSGMNLAFLGYFASGKVFPFKNLYHWPDGIFIKKFIKIEKIPGRKIINDLKLPSEIKRIIVLGSISKKSMLYLQRKYKLKITNIPLPYAPINEIIKQKIKLSSNALTLITLPTPKQEEYAVKSFQPDFGFSSGCVISLILTPKRSLITTTSPRAIRRSPIKTSIVEPAILSSSTTVPCFQSITSFREMSVRAISACITCEVSAKNLSLCSVDTCSGVSVFIEVHFIKLIIVG